jgi:endonuclease YncB( thermonuclease family)
MIARIAACFLALASIAHAGEWEKLENCRLVADEYGDGDSFHVTTGDKDYIFRLYFVDCPEADSRFPERVKGQADYFGITSKQALEIGEKGTKFTRSALREPFTVWTKWQDARGASKQHRFYAVVVAPSGDLALGLVNAGLARIFGVKTTMPNGHSAKEYLAMLGKMESRARKARRGSW